MEIRKPKRLNKDMKIGFIAPASAPDDPARLSKAKDYFSSKGYETVIGESAFSYRGYLAGSDELRTGDIHRMFADESIGCILCVRGGYGAGRIIADVDYDLIKKNPKIFSGYSDITVLHSVWLSKCGMPSLAGLMPAVDFWKTPDAYAEKIFWDLLTEDTAGYEYTFPGDMIPECFKPGTAKGRLIGGNLALITSLCGTGFLPDFRNSILFIEDVGEQPYKIDRMLNQLKISGVLETINGLIIGQFTDTEVEAEKKTLTVDEVLGDYLSALKIPILKNFPHGHISSNASLPMGITVEIDASKVRLQLLESFTG